MNSVIYTPNRLELTMEINNQTIKNIAKLTIL